MVGKNTLKGAKEFGGVKRREGGDGGGGVCVGGGVIRAEWGLPGLFEIPEGREQRSVQMMSAS